MRDDGKGSRAEARASEFLAVAEQFRLGDLPTEQSHPLTENLSELSQRAPGEALRLLHRIDAAALETTLAQRGRIGDLAAAVRATLRAGRAVHLAGCGSTGRLSLACECLWRREKSGTAYGDRVFSFMAGGDAALVRSLESFEDHPEYGARQLEEAGFRDGDLLIASTEGGETPFVIGAALRAAEVSRNPPWFLYCNPDVTLARVAERSARVLADARIQKLNLTVGPMALSGSTRMQASTALMAAVGSALLGHPEADGPARLLESLAEAWARLDPVFLEPFVIGEAETCRADGRVLYETGPEPAITLLTDTTERAPTFSMLPFENAMQNPPGYSLCYLALPEARDSAAAWKLILGRAPRPLPWRELAGAASGERLLGFDFSAAGRARRLSASAPGGHRIFSLGNTEDTLDFSFAGLSHRLAVPGLGRLQRHLILKMLLNMHSTLVMGRLGRYDGNLMTWVRPSNHKLVDRTVRYVDALLKRRGLHASYAEITRACFELMETVPPDQSLVHAVADGFQGRSGRD